MARIIEGVKETKTLLYAHNAAVSPGDVIIIGDQVLIAINKAGADVMNVYAYECRASFPKADGVGEGIGAAEYVYYDEDNEVVTDVAMGNVPLGISIEAAGDNDTEVVVDLCSFTISPVRRMPELLDDPGDGEAIPVNKSFVCFITTTEAGGETRTIAKPTFAGQRLVLSMAVDGGDCVITVASAINQTGNNTITMNDAGDYISLEGVKLGANLVWRVLGSDGVALSTVA